MQITFFWEGEGSTREACCRSDVLTRDGVDILACLLMDHGGQRQASAMQWLNEGLRLVDQVRRRAVSSADWSRDSWGAELRQDRAKIYSLYEESYFVVMPIAEFQEALSGWRDFLVDGQRD